MPHHGAKSSLKLNECHPSLIELFSNVVKYYDNKIITGHRTEPEQSKAFVKKISKVQWPDSKHNVFPSMAVDAAPWPIPENWGEDHWKDMVHFYEFAAIVKYEAAKLGLKIRWGGDWDSDNDYKDNTFDDLLHFELIT